MTTSDALTEKLAAALAPEYEIIRELGGGGMSRVFLAYEQKLDRRVVLKFLPPELSERLDHDRFHREIRLTASLSHPHIVPLYWADEIDGMPYYVMPFVDGESLEKRLERTGALPIFEAVTLAREAADGLSYAHGMGVVHRDVKPGNLLIKAGHVIVSDFGIGRAITPGDTVTLAGTVIGSPVYMSPEQFGGDHVDERADVYSLGCVLYELLIGRRPFSGSFVNILAEKTGPPPALAGIRGDVPAYICDAVFCAMQHESSARFPSMRAFADSLLPSERASAISPITVRLATGGPERAVVDPDAEQSLGTLSRAISELLRSWDPARQWGGPRSTGMAMWALAELRQQNRSDGALARRIDDILANAAEWLAHQWTSEDGGKSWESEGWDTSVSILALTYGDTMPPVADEAATWLRDSAGRSGVLYDEIWESVLALVALARWTARRRGPRWARDEALADHARGLITWLDEIPSSPSGRFINAHYSAFIIWVRAEFARAGIVEALSVEDAWLTFEEKVREAAAWLVASANANPGKLWSRFTFANAYATIALALVQDRVTVEPTLRVASRWFAEAAGSSGAFEDVEDTALAALALMGVLSAIDPHVRLRVSIQSAPPPRTFV